MTRDSQIGGGGSRGDGFALQGICGHCLETFLLSQLEAGEVLLESSR